MGGKTKIRSKRAGYTLVEMILVMSLIAILSILGITSLVGANNNNMVDETAQNIISAVRDIQNKAMSVQTEDEGIKAWAIGIYPENAGDTSQNTILFSKYIKTGTTLADTPDDIKNPSIVSRAEIKVYKYANNKFNADLKSTDPDIIPVIDRHVFIAFSTPFARSFLTIGDTCTGEIVASSLCIWKQGPRFEQDWQAEDKNLSDDIFVIDAFTNPNEGIIVDIIRKNSSGNVTAESRVVIKSNGDTFVQR